MKRLNDYFFSTSQRKEIEYRMSLCGKLEAMLGNYYLYGAGIPNNNIQVLYYDSTVKFYDVFDIIDSGEKYINPKHFSVMDLVNALYRERLI